MLLSLLLSPALASEEACNACCRAGGLSTCEPRILLYGEGSEARRDGATWHVQGLWEITCDGLAERSWSASAVLDHEPRHGELAMTPTNPLQVHCFRQACALPQGLCLSPADEDGRFGVVGCDTNLPPDGRDLARAPASGADAAATVVVVGGKPLVVHSASSGPGRLPMAVPSGPLSTTPGPLPATTVEVPATSTAAAATVTIRPDPGPAATASASDEPGLLGVTLPPDPPDPCKAPPDALRAEARKRVDLGDERRVARDAKGAAQEYRAALTMDVCNAYAWLGLGEVASGSARPDLAIRTLRNTTRIMPAHYGAWTLLGKAYEAIGQGGMAAEAYEKALAARPGLPEATEGLRRTTGR